MTLQDHEETRRLFGVIAEGLRSETQLVAEGVATANQRLERIEGRVEVLAVATDRNSIEIAALRSETGREFRASRAEVGSEFKAFRAEVASEFEDVRAEMSRGFADVRTEIAATHSDVDRRLRAVENR
jgi:hypothetical protein